MKLFCLNCNEPIKDGDRVTIIVCSVYHEIPSSIAYALDRNEMIADKESIMHASCRNGLV